MANGTGLGASCTAFTGVTIANWRVRSIGGLEVSCEALDDTSLDSTGYEETISSDLKTVGPMELECYWGFDEDLPDVGDTGSISVTLPQQGAASAGTIAGTGYISSVSTPTLSPNERTVGTLVWAFDGKTGPTWTKNS